MVRPNVPDHRSESISFSKLVGWLLVEENQPTYFTFTVYTDGKFH